MSDRKFEFRDWMNANKLKVPAVAPRFGITAQTARHWRSKGVPDTRQDFVSKTIAAWDVSPPIGDRLAVTCSYDEFDDWNRAATEEGKTIREWARDGLNLMGRIHFNDPQLKLRLQNQFGPTKESPPILKVADDIAEYKVTPRAGNGGSSGE